MKHDAVISDAIALFAFMCWMGLLLVMAWPIRKRGS